MFFDLKGNAISASQGCFKVEVLITQSCLTLCNPMDLQETVARQSPLSMRFSRQEYWSALSFPSPGDLPISKTKPGSPALQVDSLPFEPPRKKKQVYTYIVRFHWDPKYGELSLGREKPEKTPVKVHSIPSVQACLLYEYPWKAIPEQKHIEMPWRIVPQ